MNESTTMIKQKIALMLLAAAVSFSAIAQPTHAITDPEKKYKDAKELFARDQFALAYPLFAELRSENPANTISNHTYLNDDVNYYYIACELKLQQPIAEQEAKHYIEVVSNEPRRQLLSVTLLTSMMLAISESRRPRAFIERIASRAAASNTWRSLLRSRSRSLRHVRHDRVPHLL